jgi:hypothetical protein
MMFAPPQMPTFLPPAAARASVECGLDPLRHEGVRRTALHRQGLSLFVSHDEYWHPKRRWVAPRLEADVEHPLPQHDRPGRGIDLVHDRGVGLGLRVEHPVVKPLPTIPSPLPARTFGPVMNPSNDIDISPTTLLM